MDAHLAAEYDLMLKAVAGLRILYLYHIYALVVLIKADKTAVVGDNGNALGLTRLKQLLYAGQTLRNIAGGGDTAGVEGSHGQLGTGFTDGLCRDDAHGFTDGDRGIVGKVGAVAAAACAVLGTAVDNAADLQAGNAGIHDLLCGLVGDHLLTACQQLAGLGIHHVLAGITAGQALRQILNDAVAVGDGFHINALMGAAVLLADNDLLRYIDQAAGQITGVCGTQCGIRQTLTGAAAGLEVFQNVKSLAVIRTNGDFDGLTGGIGNVAAHTGKLVDLIHRTTGAGIRHHVDGIQLTEVLLQRGFYLVGGVTPDGNGLLVAVVL